MYRSFGKRWLDAALSLIALVLLSPFLAVLAVLIRLKLGSPVFFKQSRPGRDARPFTIWKFRTMKRAEDARGRPLSDAQRLTGLGAVLRRLSLDELPEIFNVLRGDMSLVGPRPLLMEYVARYNLQQARRHEVLPGLTGWAQVNGRNAVSWEKKFELDVWYIDHLCLWLDLKILTMTVVKVFRREGISAQGHATMPEFMGSRGDGVENEN